MQEGSRSLLKRQEPQEKVQMGRSPSSLLHLDNDPILSQQGGRSGQAKRLQDAGPRFVIKFWFLFGSNCLSDTENKTRDPNCLNERTPVCNKTRESVGVEFRQEQTMPDTSSVPTTSHSQVFVSVCLCACLCVCLYVCVLPPLGQIWAWFDNEATDPVWPLYGPSDVSPTTSKEYFVPPLPHPGLLRVASYQLSPGVTS